MVRVKEKKNAKEEVDGIYSERSGKLAPYMYYAMKYSVPIG